MEFVPLDSFEFLNSLLHSVEAQGCLMTVRLEAFTCRSTRKKKQLAVSMAEYANKTTPPLVPNYSSNLPQPPLLTLPGTGANSAGGGSLPSAIQPEPVDPDDIDDRLVFLVAALNSIYGKDGYDFSVLREADFERCDEEAMRAEVNVTLQSMPHSCTPAVENFWTLVCEQASDESQGCEYFRFACPSCDPMASRSLFSQHYFLYNKRSRLLVSLQVFAEGNSYRGDDGLVADGVFYCEGEDTSGRPKRCYSSQELASSDDDAMGGKNIHFYHGQ
ncbi:putative Maf1 regulator [Trypanosoma vivax]|uniref:Repressor of RNA polymerase III transcription n=1 Tax=Trypanosoma vivax (strain Y486) TaxID=1055687 RepID=F9WS45_TRYVY|nr:hypothetical protein TRVL_09431 [Trypanosoma vivax]KAH8610828.1 putative Maf1 regulator [Trypanosoma vivax]CCC47780.1 conserved hypothetical protein [Trypanosoma vivax Y486]CCD20383.1 hypothetical protein, conserved [Trypanosoma vivax Y486]|eukprot:CCD20383.1 hypothetical protein, conserved [Trypanosoma vivax Y486]